MQELYVESLHELLRNKRRIERELHIKLRHIGKNVFVEGKAEDEYLALEVLKAVQLGFSVDTSLHLKEEGILLYEVNIKDVTKRKDFERVRGRIIGTHGRTLQTLKTLTGCSFSLSYNMVGIIGDSDTIYDAIDAVRSLIQGSTQGNVYSRLEKQRREKRLRSRDIGLEFEKKE